MKDKILLFIPMYNCEKQIVRVIEQLKGDIKYYISEAIIVNNRSTDDGEKAAIEKIKGIDLPFGIKVLRNDENYGLGGSHKVAFNYAVDNEFDYCIVLHGDDQGDINDLIPALRKKVYRKYECLLGARFTNKSRLIGYSKFRIFGNFIFNIVFSLAMKQRIYDLGAGLNMYSVGMLKSKYYCTYPDNLTFNVYMLMATEVFNQRYFFFPLTWRETDQISNAKVMSQAVSTLKMLIKFTFKGKTFLKSDARKKKYADYTFHVVYEEEQ